MFKVILIFLLFSNTVLATCPPVQYLKVGDVVRCSGYLFTPAQELEVRSLNDNYAKLLKVTTSQDELIGVMDKRIELQMNINKNLRDQNSYLQRDTAFQKAIWFGLGVLSTGVIVYMTQRK